MAYLKWNGFTLTTNVRFEELVSTPVYAEDGLQHVTTRHVIRGTGLITAATEAAFHTRLIDARARLLRPRDNAEDFLIAYGNHATPASKNIIAEISAADTAVDQFEGPLGKFTINRIFGALAAIVAFEITWHQYDLSGTDTSTEVIGHKWTQRWVVDASGMTTRTTVGVVVVRADALTTEADVAGNNPDRFRALILPRLEDGFRRERMDFASDETGLRLMYNVEDKEYARDLPSPAYTGNGSFTYRRARSASGMLGQKTFSIELTADRGTVPSTLYDSIIKVTRTRIDYNADIIDLIQVEEPLFDTNTVRVRVVARSVTGGGLMKPPNFQLWDNVMSGQVAGGGDPTEALPGYGDKSPYGGALLASVRRALFLQTDTGKVASQTAGTAYPNAPYDGDNTVYMVPKADAQLLAATAIPPPVTPGWSPGSPEFTGAQDEELNVADANIVDTTHESHTANPYVGIQMVESLNMVDTGMRLSRPQSLNGTDRPMQMRRPEVYYIQEGTASRIGLSPSRDFRPPPDGSILISSEWHPSIGAVDEVNTHVYSIHYRTVWQLTDRAPNMTVQPGYGAPVEGGFAAFWPSTNGAFGINMPLDHRLDPASQASEQHIMTQSSAYQYFVGAFPGISTPTP